MSGFNGMLMASNKLNKKLELFGENDKEELVQINSGFLSKEIEDQIKGLRFKNFYKKLCSCK